MNIIDHLSVGVPAVDEATEFYDAVLGRWAFNGLPQHKRLPPMDKAASSSC